VSTAISRIHQLYRNSFGCGAACPQKVLRQLRPPVTLIQPLRHPRIIFIITISFIVDTNLITIITVLGVLLIAKIINVTVILILAIILLITSS
jgi:hypothetical protein